MKKTLSVVLALVLLMTSASAFAAKKSSKKYEPKYTMPAEGVVLQDIADRNITPKTDLSDNPVIEGQSPVTGLPYDTSARYMPMLVQISNPSDGVLKVNGKKVNAAGIEKRSPWSGQFADIVYEGILYRTGQTRITFLFSDSLADGEPTSAGPVRSARMGHVYLREEWGGGLAFEGGPRRPGNNVFEALKELGANDKGTSFYAGADNDHQYSERVKGLKAPENVTVNPAKMYTMVPETTIATPHPFLFSDVSPYTDGYDIAYTINLDWGHEHYISHFYYDEAENLYLRYTGPVPYTTFASVDDRSEENKEQISFSNVIIERVNYEYNDGSSQEPLMQGIGKGNADIFIGGRYIAGYWVRQSAKDRTIFFDDQGNEIQLTPGKTYIAHFPPTALLTYQGIQ